MQISGINILNIGTVLLWQYPLKLSYSKYSSYTFQFGRILVTLMPEFIPSTKWGRIKYKELDENAHNIYDDYINNFPYLLSIRLGIINKSSIKSFRNADGHEELNKKHDQKFVKKKSKGSVLPSPVNNKANLNETSHLKTSSMDLLNKLENSIRNRSLKEEVKIDDSVNIWRPDHQSKAKEAFYATTDIRTSTSVDPTFSLVRHPNNFMNDEHISITHRLREINNSISNNESIVQINNNESNIVGSINDKDSYLLGRPKRSLTTDYEEMVSPHRIKNNKFHKQTENIMFPHIRNRTLMKPNEQGFMKSFETRELKNQFEEVKEINEEEYENLRDHNSNSISSRREKERSEEDKEERKAETKLNDYENSNDNKNKHTSLSLFPLEIGKNNEQKKDEYTPEPNLNTLKLKNNYFNQSVDSEAKEVKGKIVYLFLI